MNRKSFLASLTGAVAMGGLAAFKKYTDGLAPEGEKMPVLFIGHGSPMNGIEDNEFSRRWEEMGKQIPRPNAVLVVSAHWLSRGTYITAMENPKTIHDFGGFPKALFDVQYPAPGDPALAKTAQALIHTTAVGLDHDWGLDHGAWTVVRRMYPEAQIPVLQLSIDYGKPASYHYELARELAALRRKGVLIVGSGNMVHNLRLIDWENMHTDNFGFDWAIEMHHLFMDKIREGDHQALIRYETLSPSARLAIPTPDHYFPLLYTLALQEKNEEPLFFNNKLVAGSLNMTSVRFG